MLLGMYLLLDDGDILIGFLWVIDLGVGLVFFIFIVHYSTFLYQKVKVAKTSRELCFIVFSGFFLSMFLFFFTSPLDVDYTTGFNGVWFMFMTWYDYYDFLFTYVITDLNLLREMYFYNNSFEFFIINFMLLFGIITAILLTFMIKRIFTFVNLSQLVNYDLLKRVNTTYFIRNQNILKQQATSTGTRVWIKQKYKKNGDLS